MRHMQLGQHIGKLLLRMPSDANELPGPALSPDPTFRSDATYMLVGGLGGLGKTVANWMVEHGAKHIVCVGRSAGKWAEDDKFLEELAVQGCKAVCVAGDIAQPDTIKTALAACSHPLRGVCQMSAVLRVSDLTLALSVTPTPTLTPISHTALQTTHTGLVSLT